MTETELAIDICEEMSKQILTAGIYSYELDLPGDIVATVKGYIGHFSACVLELSPTQDVCIITTEELIEKYLNGVNKLNEAEDERIEQMRRCHD